MNRTNYMAQHVEQYLALRRAFGFQLNIAGQQLQLFARFADRTAGGQPLTQELALRWAQSSSTGKQTTAARRLLILRPFTRYLRTLPMQTRALREHATRRGWKIALQVREIGSGAAQRELREQLLEAARPPGDRRGVSLAAGSLGPVGHGPAGDASGTGASGSGVRFADRGPGLDHARRSSHGGPAGGLRGVRKGDSPRTSTRRLGPRPPEWSAPRPAGNCGPPHG